MGKIRTLFLEANPFTTTQPGLDESVCIIRNELQHLRNLVFDSDRKSTRLNSSHRL